MSKKSKLSHPAIAGDVENIKDNSYARNIPKGIQQLLNEYILRDRSLSPIQIPSIFRLAAIFAKIEGIKNVDFNHLQWAISVEKNVPSLIPDGDVKNREEFLKECYQVQEMPILKNNIRMELEELKRFCECGLPLFVLKVEETVHDGVPFPVHDPYCKWFTLWGEWGFYAIERIDKLDEPSAAQAGEVHAV